MNYIPTNLKINLEWAVKKGVGNEAEDFSRSTVALFVFSDENRWAVPCEADYTGVVRAQLPETMPEGVYNLDLVWYKNESSLGSTRSVQRTRKTCVFAIDAATLPPAGYEGQPVTLKMSSIAAPYGYDGLSAYEIAVLRGATTLDEYEWSKGLFNDVLANELAQNQEEIKNIDEKYKQATSRIDEEISDLPEIRENLAQLSDPIKPLALNAEGQIELHYGEGLIIRDGKLCATGGGGGEGGGPVYSEGEGITISDEHVISLDEEAQYVVENAVTSEETEISVESLEEGLMQQALRKTPQILSEAEKTQARENIGAVSASEAVCVDKQNFNGTEKAQARENIDAITASEAEQIAEDKIYETSVSSPEKLQTIQELAAWMESNPDSAATMNLQIQENAEDIAELGIYTENSEYIRVCTDAEGKFLWGIKHDGEIHYGVGVPEQIAQNYGHYEDCIEFIRVCLDNEGKVVFGIQDNGNVVFGAGVPKQVIDYISARIDELSLDEYENIVAFFDGLETGDKNLQELLDARVPVEEGKGLVDEDFANGISYIDNPEFIEVKLSQDEKILEGTKADGTKVFSSDVELIGSMNINGVEYSLINSPEWLVCWIDSSEKVIFGIKHDGKTCIGDADFFENITQNFAAISEIENILNNKIGYTVIDWDALTPFGIAENHEYAEIETDSTNKVLGGRRSDGTKFENVAYELGGHLFKNIDDTERRANIITDCEDRIIAYRNEDGTQVENVGIQTNSLVLTEHGMTEFQKALVASGFKQGGGDWSNYVSKKGKEPLQLDIPRVAIVNFTNTEGNLPWPTSKTGRKDYQQGINADFEAIIEYADTNGQYFKKNITFTGQGNSSMAYVKKNCSIKIFDGSIYNDKGKFGKGDKFGIQFGDWVSQDGFHLKAYMTDSFVGIPAVLYDWFRKISKTRGTYQDTPWKRALIPDDVSATTTADFTDDYSLLFDTGARCVPAGFPCLVYLNGTFYGIYSWQLKKDQDNYHMEDDNGSNVHLDGNISGALLWNANGNIEWIKWGGIITETETSTNKDGIEIRNPKDIILRNGEEYDIDSIVLLDPATVDIREVEPICDTDPEWETLYQDEELREAMLYTNTAKKAIIALSKVIPAIRDAETASYDSTESKNEHMRTLISTYFDVDSLIDYQIFSDIIRNEDGMAKNWQWTTWDGIRWAAHPYDLDWTMGLHGETQSSHTAFWPPITRHLGTHNDNRPNYWVVRYFNEELEERYKSLRDSGTISVEAVIEPLNDWTLAVGQRYYKKDCEKWPDRIQDSIYRVYNWLKESLNNMDTIYHYNN